MTRKIHELLDQFSGKTVTEQMQEIQRARHTRNIERPAAAKKRRKKEAAKSTSNKTKLIAMLRKMSPADQAAMLEKLGAKDED